MQAKVTLSRSAQFAAGRVLRRHDWSDARNLEVYGKQSRPHGHDYTLIVYYRGVPSHVDGMVVNISVLKTVINDVLAPLDGALLNELPAFKLRPPTAENLVDFLWTQLPATIAGGVLTRLCLQETRDLHVEKLQHAMRITRKYEFAAAHRLHAPQLSEEQNFERYGKCNNPSGHGHNYGLEVTLEGTPDAESGVLLAPQAFDAIIDQEIFARFDHKHLNVDCSEFTNLIPTSENLSRVIFEILDRRFSTTEFPLLRLAKVGLYETQKNYFEVEA